MPIYDDPKPEDRFQYHKKPLTKAEVRQIKRKLNIPTRAPLPKCPAKSKRKIKLLIASGILGHDDPKHAPCELCTCDNTAGLGTIHYGYGWCHVHERKKPTETKERMANADLIAHQQRHPRVFRDANQYLDNIEKQGKKDETSFDLTNEMDKARILVNAMYSRLSGMDEIDNNNVIQVMQDVQDALSKQTVGDAAMLQALTDEVKKLEVHFINGDADFTEKGKGGPQSISDKSRYELQLDSSEKLARISERVLKLKLIDSITKESFNAWLYRFLQELKHEFAMLTYTRKDGSFQIIEGIGDSMKRAGDPKRGI